MLSVKNLASLPKTGSIRCFQRCLSTTRVNAARSKAAAVMEKEAENILAVYARYPVAVSHGKGSFLWDVDGNKYIDFTSGVAVNALGHAEENVQKLAADQLTKVVHASNLFYNEPAIELAAKLNQSLSENSNIKMPSKVFFVNSGAEANETAIKFARKYAYTNFGPQKNEIVFFNNSFHGRTMGALSITANPKYREAFKPLLPGCKQAKFNDASSLGVIDENTAAVIVEPVQGEGGICPAEAEFLAAVRKACDKHNVMLIYDEVQCGLGRTGDLWAHSYVKDFASPDIVTLAKPLANGLPIGVTIVSDDIAKTIKFGDHGSTFGGNPVACRVGSYCVDKIGSSEILNNVRTQHKALTARFDSFKEKFPSIIRGYAGRGLLMGLQFHDAPTKFIDFARERGLLLLPGGNNNTRVLPALNTPSSVIADGLDIMEDSLEALAK
ncbi:acetylornithine aminotransferase [Schizosaccharomyces japonicus yFS275]|uniref:acetylornithine transaminase n=1 Tax=Schizosaccharomyces japonicus (strain yFS275 / FY16936) TaxID=402676 RepID=B6JX94_SCHJY|nr:acetylornithine aminotransferase [Schizosaccharomyces japonicus yFS275]EEB05995.1 acetylornithine aminotransferase [Schizosaccharomyces japonicus yFS275]